MKKLVKISTLIILIIILLGCSVDAISIDSNTANNFINNGKSPLISMSAMYSLVNFLYGVAMTIAIAVAIIKGALLAFQIITGSLDERMNAKKMLIDYVFLVIILAIGPAVLQAIMKIMKSNL